MSLLLALIVAATPVAEDKGPALVLPPTGAADTRPLALLAQERATALLSARGKSAFFHLKQAAAVAASEGLDLYGVADPKAARAFGDALGAAHVAFGKLATDAKGATVLELQVASGARAAAAVKKLTLPKGLGAAAEAAGVALANALEQSMGRKAEVKGEPVAAKDEAMLEYARCLSAVVEQPLGVENPAVLDEAAIAGAVKAGEAAVAGGAGDGARAALGLALAIAGNDTRATEVLAAIPQGPKAPTLSWLGRFWLVTRYQSDDAGVAALKDALRANPNDLLVQGYLGELLQVLGRHEEAQVVFSDLSKVAPRDPFAQARLAKSVARLGKNDEAIARTQSALGLAPNNRELRLQLGSRFIDAKKWDDATTVLALLATEAPTGEHHLRLGFALLQRGDTARAEETLKKALALATAPREWRTRARANEDLAALAVKRGQKEVALGFLQAALKEGYRPRAFAPDLQPLAKELERRELRAKVDAGALALVPRLRDASPFTVAPDGEVDLAAARPRVIPGLEALGAGGRTPFEGAGKKTQ